MNKTLVTCNECQTSYSIPYDDTKLEITCKKCKHVFIWEPPFIKSFKKKIKENITQIENRTDITDDEKVTKIVTIFSSGCAALATQPLPGMDIFYLTGIQAYMGTRIGTIRGLPVSESKATVVIKELFGVVGLGMLGQNFVLTAYKIGVPGLGGFMTIPLVFGATYAIGKTMDLYFKQKRKNGKVDPEELKKMWKKMKKEGKDLGKKEKANILRSRDDYKAQN